MLRRKKTAKRILIGLAIIIIPAFVLWGAGSLSKKRLPFKYIGIIDGKKITVDRFIQSAKDVQIGLFLSYFNQPEALKKLQEDRRLLNGLAWENLLIETSAKEAGFKVSDEEVVNFISVHPLFSRGGVFDDKLYKYILRNNLRITPRVFEESIRNFMITAKFKSDIVKSATVTDQELLQSYKNEFEKAKVNYVLIDKENFKENTSVAESEIEAFYSQNKELFKDPDKVIVQYIAFPHEEEGSKEKALEDIKKVFGKMKSKPRNMEKISSDFGLTIKETAPFSYDEIAPELANVKGIGLAFFRLKPIVHILPVVDENEKGTSYIVRVKEKVPPRIKSIDEVSSYIKGLLRDKKAALVAEEKAKEFKSDADISRLNIKEIAEKYGLEFRKTDLITRFDYIEGAGESYKIVDGAFKADGKIPEPIQTRSGFAIIEPVELIFIDEKEFEKKKEDYKNKALTIRKLKALENWFRNAKTRAILNVDLDRI